MRFSFFSHIQDLATDQLVLTSPFRVDSEHPSRCAYELHASNAEMLAPDPAWHGMAQFHRWLPFPQKEIASLEGIPIFLERNHHSFNLTGEILTMEHVIPHPGLPHLIGLKQAQLDGHLRTHAPALGMEDVRFCHSAQPAEFSLQVPPAWSQMLKPHPQLRFEPVDSTVQASTSLGPWHHPFRLEGMKLAALELYHTCPEPPTILLKDPSGEWAFAFLEAANLIRHCQPQARPFRLIILEEKPFDRLCRAFEGRPSTPETPLQNPPPAFQPLPAQVIDHIVAGVTDLAGTAVACDPGSPNLTGTPIAQSALEALTRTGFIDEEDHLIFLQPYCSPADPTTSGGS